MPRPILHRHRDMPLCTAFGKIQQCRQNAILMLLVGIGLFHHPIPNPLEEEPRGGGILVVVKSGVLPCCFLSHVSLP